MKRLIYEKFGYNGHRATMREATEKDLLLFSEATPVPCPVELPAPPKYVSRNANGMARRAYVIAMEEANAEAAIVTQYGHWQWYKVPYEGSYVENGRTYGLRTSIYIASPPT